MSSLVNSNRRRKTRQREKHREREGEREEKKNLTDLEKLQIKYSGYCDYSEKFVLQLKIFNIMLVPFFL